MQILLVASESLAKAVIFTLLSFSAVPYDFIPLKPEDLDFVSIDDIDIVIYVDHRPCTYKIDWLRKNSKSLILVASEALGFEYDLFVPIKAFDACETMFNAVNSIKCFIRPTISQSQLSNLTTRQVDILRLMRLGQSKKKIIDKLDICPRTYQLHVDKLRTVFGATSDIALIHKIHEMGIILQPPVAA
jgi:DNA-binding CsgD family transcriptional regulator